jgi:hypothetical protein
VGSDGEGSDDGTEVHRDDILFGSTRPTSHQSRLANLFRPPFDIIRNVDLEQVGVASASRLNRKTGC